MGLVAVALNILYKLDLCIVYRTLHVKFGVSRFKSNSDLLVHTDIQIDKDAARHDLLDSANVPEQK